MLVVAQLLLRAILAGQFLSELLDKERPSPSRLGVGDGADTPLVKAQLF
jgi:hypothetical protein